MAKTPDPILYCSTNGIAPEVDLQTALLAGLAPDKGLYLPTRLPRFRAKTIAAFRCKKYDQVATEVLWPFVAQTFDYSTLAKLCHAAYNFKIPINHINKTHVLRLDQGPTASFKDFAARLMAQMIGQIVMQTKQPLLILVATSGDTGSAVANAFLGIDGIEVVVLFPQDEVSDRQRKLMTTLGDNVRCVSVLGKFDDCQAMVKKAFSDKALAHLHLSSANSINIGRLLPQIVYYFYAASRIAEAGEPIIFSVPSGNFGNMMAAVLARRMGLPMEKLVVATNSNDEFPRFLQNGKYEKIVPSKNCISNAMNVGHPSNLARLIQLYNGWMDETGQLREPPDLKAMRQDIFSCAISDEETRQTIIDAWKDSFIMLEPHGAVAWAALLKYREESLQFDQPAICLETAHPAKFDAEIQALLDCIIPTPFRISAVDAKSECFDSLPVDYDTFRDYLIVNY